MYGGGEESEKNETIKGGRMDRRRGRIGEVEKKNYRGAEERIQKRKRMEKEKHNSLEMQSSIIFNRFG